MKLIIENFRKFLIEELSIGISQEINDEVLDKVFEWAGVTDRSSIKHLGSASMGSAYKINSKDFGEVVLKITNDGSEAHSTANLINSGQDHPIPEIQYAMGSLYASVRMGEKGFHQWRGFGNDAKLDKKIDVIANDGKTTKGLDPKQIKSYIDKIASGLTFLKNQGTDFTDLKASNVLQRGQEPVIIDLGRVAIPKYSTIEDI